MMLATTSEMIATYTQSDMSFDLSSSSNTILEMNQLTRTLQNESEWTLFP